MLTISATCCHCDTTGPVEAIATRRDGRQFALCPACAMRPGGLRALVAHLQLRSPRHDDLQLCHPALAPGPLAVARAGARGRR